MNTIIYRRVNPERFEQFEATIVGPDGKIKEQKVLWSKFAIERWAQRIAGPNFKEIQLWGKQKLRNQIVMWEPQTFVGSAAP